ncbi:MAG: sorbosone dehydrogenase family protein [Acidimicrobiia bacterium]
MRASTTVRLAAAGLVAALFVSACSDDGTSGSTTVVTQTGSTQTPTSRTASASTGATGGVDATRPTTDAPVSDPPVGDPAKARLTLVEVARLDEPIAIAVRPGDATLYVAERQGTVRAIRDGALDPDVVLDMSSRTKAEGERGLLGMTFDPDGAHLYVHYTNRSGDTRVDEYRVGAAGQVDPSTRREVLAQDQPYSNHNGGHVLFGPDGLLYIGLGDGGSGGDPQNRAQDLGTLLGKILRIDPKPNGDKPYSIPADNPFVDTEGARPEIWSYGLRNPWRFSFDATGALWIGDVGQNKVEEIDRVAGPSAGRGVNFGWRRFEGDSVYNAGTDAPDAVGPILTAAHDDGACSITGGSVYEGSQITALDGVYVFADVCWDTLRAFTDSGGMVDLGLTAGSPVSIQIGPDGEMYVCDLDGVLWRIAPAS